ncbi:hypothetical protein CK203_028646 [Vitis vinifera]|uniref:Uncharacterized protein n=1 Tax=Vitis vinifera TaxID=29760 RepID=A0A438IF32_VITVI|nr:hypothetical protein CK203_028646 [Vitis vinifera]
MEESNFVAGVEHVAGDMPEGVPTGNASSLKMKEPRLAVGDNIGTNSLSLDNIG